MASTVPASSVGGARGVAPGPEGPRVAVFSAIRVPGDMVLASCPAQAQLTLSTSDATHQRTLQCATKMTGTSRGEISGRKPHTLWGFKATAPEPGWRGKQMASDRLNVLTRSH